jgi:hypothetical protein
VNAEIALHISTCSDHHQRFNEELLLTLASWYEVPVGAVPAFLRALNGRAAPQHVVFVTFELARCALVARPGAAGCRLPGSTYAVLQRFAFCHMQTGEIRLKSNCSLIDSGSWVREVLNDPLIV